MLTRLLCFFILIWNSVAIAPAGIRPQRLAGLAAPDSPRPLPFNPGETLVYEVNFSKLFFSGTIGSLTLTVATPGGVKHDSVEFKAEGVSKGFFTWLFKVKVNDRFVSLVNADDFGLESSTQNIEEGRVRREQKLTVDRVAGKAAYTVKNLAQKSRGDKFVEAESPAWVQDILSAVYYIRTQPLKEGDKITIPVIDSAKLYNIDVIAGKREDVTAGKSKYRVVQLDVKAFDGRYVKRSGQMSVWVTDDPSHTPVKARIKTAGYTVHIELTRKSSQASVGN